MISDDVKEAGLSATFWYSWYSDVDSSDFFKPKISIKKV